MELPLKKFKISTKKKENPVSKPTAQLSALSKVKAPSKRKIKSQLLIEKLSNQINGC